MFKYRINLLAAEPVVVLASLELSLNHTHTKKIILESSCYQKAQPM